MLYNLYVCYPTDMREEADDRIEESMSGITWDLAVIEVLRWNKFDLDRILQNENRLQDHKFSRIQEPER